MRNTKRSFMNYAFFDRTGIQKYLEKMALRGWLVKDISRTRWEFVRIEPRKLRFSVCYFPRKTADGETEAQRREEFIEFCRHSGWELAAQSGSMLIWYHSSENPVPIETDPELELDTIHKGAKGFLHTCYISIGIMLAWVCWLLIRMSKMPLESALEGYFSYGLVFAVFGLKSVYELALYYIWRRKAIRAVRENGAFVETKSWPMIGGIFWILFVLAVGAYGAFANNEPFLISAIAYCAGMFFAEYVSRQIRAANSGSEEIKATTSGSMLKLLLIIGLALVLFVIVGLF